ncbi:hypothetical protein D9Q98_000430 [Chlorella vulgaris]|uniref:RING-CH-type domain-containing protein n=1 Tax=Chlorella vulgaris TaxID=3077 RepID=A0A9D4TYD9_CHLVU|nr:hypothetical protein D9Q98_000430 [Chlorella vulgaris]
MAAASASASTQQEHAALLREEASNASPAPTTAENQPDGPQDSESRPWHAAWRTWFRRAPADAQRLSQDGDELDERHQDVAVVLEAATTDTDSAAPSAADVATSGTQQQQHQQHSGDVASGSGSSGNEIGSRSEIEVRRPGSPHMARLPSRGPPTCLICLEEFTQEEFVNGAALRLECNCRGDLALRHRDCVMKWVQVKGSNVCELCKAEIRNIPAPPPRPTEDELPTLDEAYFNDPNHIQDFMPSSQDLVFDCIRVTWVACIVSVLFFEMSLGAALWTGLLAGCAYSIMVRLMYRQHFHAMRRLAEQQAAARRDLEAGTVPVVVSV